MGHRYSVKRTSFDKGFHTYAMEWDEKFMRFYTDSRIHTMLDLQTTGKKGGFWDRAGYVVLPLPSSNVPH